MHEHFMNYHFSIFKFDILTVNVMLYYYFDVIIFIYLSFYSTY